MWPFSSSIPHPRPVTRPHHPIIKVGEEPSRPTINPFPPVESLGLEKTPGVMEPNLQPVSCLFTSRQQI